MCCQVIDNYKHQYQKAFCQPQNSVTLRQKTNNMNSWMLRRLVRIYS